MRVLGVGALVKLDRTEVGVVALLDRLIAGDTNERINPRPGRLVEQGAVERARGSSSAGQIDHGRYDAIFKLLQPQGLSANGVVTSGRIWHPSSNRTTAGRERAHDRLSFESIAKGLDPSWTCDGSQ